MKNRVGFIIIVIGILHTILGVIKFSEVFSQMMLEGLFNTGIGSHRGWAVWFTVTGIVFIILGFALKFIEESKLNIPNNIGWGCLGVAILGGIIIPLSGFWALLLPGILIISSKKG